MTTDVRYWFNDFKNIRTSVFNDERLGGPIEMTTKDMIHKIHDNVLADR